MALREEVIDRFGSLPPATQNLFTVTRARLVAAPLGLRKVDMSAQGGRLIFDARPNIDPMSVIRLVQQQPKAYRLDGGDKLRILKQMPEPQARVEELFGLLSFLTSSANTRLETADARMKQR